MLGSAAVTIDASFGVPPERLAAWLEEHQPEHHPVAEPSELDDNPEEDGLGEPVHDVPTLV